MKFKPCRDVELGAEATHIIHAIIEVPKGGKAKYELDKGSGMLRLDGYRSGLVLGLSVHHHVNHGS